MRLVGFTVEVTAVCCSAFAVSAATGLRAGRSGVRIPGGAADFSLLQNVQTSYGANRIPSSVLTRVLCRGESGRDLKLTTHFRLVRRLRM